MAISPPLLPPAISVISQFTFMVLATRVFYIECVQDLGSCHRLLRFTFTTGMFERLPINCKQTGSIFWQPGTRRAIRRRGFPESQILTLW